MLIEVRKKDRLKRINILFLQIHKLVGGVEHNMEAELDVIHNNVLFKPWCRRLYCSAL